MTQPPHSTASSLYAALFYRDAPAAQRWLVDAFGFAIRMSMPGPDGTIVHSELTLGDSVIMVGSPKPERGWRSPLDLGGVATTLCLYVEDVDAHYARAVAAGAVMINALDDTDYGSRGYDCRDPEGHVWSFGTYRPGAYWDSPSEA